MHQLQYTTSFLPSYFQFTGGTPPGFELSEPAVDYTVSRELNIYVDESGNISTKKTSSLCYMIGLVFHESTNDISKAESRLEEEFTALGYPNTCFHCAPVIYGKDKFQFEGLGTRRRLMKTFFAFFRHLDITHREFAVEKKNLTRDGIRSRLAAMIHEFIRTNISYFISFSKITIFYDNGQDEIREILENEFVAFLSEVRMVKLKPSESRLLQVADLICTLRWLQIKERNIGLTNSETVFFIGSKRMNYQYLKTFETKELKK